MVKLYYIQREDGDCGEFIFAKSIHDAVEISSFMIDEEHESVKDMLEENDLAWASIAIQEGLAFDVDWTEGKIPYEIDIGLQKYSLTSEE